MCLRGSLYLFTSIFVFISLSRSIARGRWCSTCSCLSLGLRGAQIFLKKRSSRDMSSEERIVSINPSFFPLSLWRTRPPASILPHKKARADLKKEKQATEKKKRRRKGVLLGRQKTYTQREINTERDMYRERYIYIFLHMDTPYVTGTTLQLERPLFHGAVWWYIKMHAHRYVCIHVFLCLCFHVFFIFSLHSLRLLAGVDWWRVGNLRLVLRPFVSN